MTLADWLPDPFLRTRAEVGAFEHQHGVDTTPPVFVKCDRIGGSDNLEQD